jgi:hypothetical protein
MLVISSKKSCEQIEKVRKEEKELQSIRYVAMVGFTIPEFGWHDHYKNKFYGTYKSPVVAWAVANFFGYVNCFLHYGTGEGIFHSIVAIEKGTKVNNDFGKKIVRPELGVR